MEGSRKPVRKAKKKAVKDELDRIKQAEKKKRRLEKALATSAAIRLELEKKKQNKKNEEQERLYEEGARIAEAAALHVLLGEDSDDYPCNNTPWDHHDIIVGRGQPLIPFCNLSKYSPIRDIGWVSECCERSDYMVSSDTAYVGDLGSVGHLAARVVSSLKIAEDDAYALNHMFGS